jgi:hypothetical protein
MGTGVLARGVKRPGRNANHAFSCGTEVKNDWRYTSTPHLPYVYEFHMIAPNNQQLFPQALLDVRFLGALEKLRLATVSFVMSVRPSVCPCVATRLTPAGFS